MPQDSNGNEEHDVEMFAEPLDSDFLPPSRPSSTTVDTATTAVAAGDTKESKINNKESTPTNGNSTPAASKKARKFACVECRQQKSKCDAHDRAPLPCTKCAKKNVPCILK